MNKQFQQLNSLSRLHGKMEKAGVIPLWQQELSSRLTRRRAPDLRAYERHQGSANAHSFSSSRHCCHRPLTAAQWWGGSEKWVVRRFCRENITECTYIDLAATAHRTPKLYQRITCSWATNLYHMQYVVQSNCHSIVFVYLNMENVQHNMV